MMKTLTISRAMIGLQNKFIGVASIDLLVSDLQKILQKVVFYDTGFLILVDRETGLVMNDPFYRTKTDQNNKTTEIEPYYIFNQTITGLNETQWNEIKDQSEFDSIEAQRNGTTKSLDYLVFTNHTGDRILIMKNSINSTANQLILLVYVNENEA